jgi:hypothetical protein
VTAKMPAGVKHSPCITHVPHAYPANGWLCVTTDEATRADNMRAFADHLVEVVARHREPRRIAYSLQPQASIRGTRPDDMVGPMLAECDWQASVASCQLPIAQAIAPVVAPAPVKARKPRAVKVAPVVDVMPESVEPETSSRRDDNGEPEPQGAALAHDFGDPCHCIECEPVAAPVKRRGRAARRSRRVVRRIRPAVRMNVDRIDRYLDAIASARTDVDILAAADQYAIER